MFGKNVEPKTLTPKTWISTGNQVKGRSRPLKLKLQNIRKWYCCHIESEHLALGEAITFTNTPPESFLRKPQ